MKNKLGILTKNSLFNTFNINKLFGKGNKSKGIRTGILSLFIIIVMFSYVCIYSYMGIEFLKQYNLEHYIPVLFYIATGIFMVMMSIYRVKNVLFDAKDNDMLLSMPIKFKDILASRLMNLYIMNLLYSIIMFLPSAILYGVICTQNILLYILSLLMAIILPIVPVVIASLLGFVIAYITSKSNKHKMVELVITFAMFFVVFFGVSYIQKIAMKFVENINGVEITLKKYAYSIYLIKDVIANNNIISFVILALITITIAFVFVIILANKYKKIISKLKEERKVTKKGIKGYSKNSVVTTLLKKELKRYFGITVYVFNTAFAPILCIIFTVYILISGSNAIMSTFNEAGMELSSLFNIMLIITSFLVCTTNTTCSSISLEGKNLWVLKSLPVKEMSIFKSKIMLNLLLILPVILLCTILMYLKLRIGIIECAINLILIIVLSLCITQFGLIINLKFPKLDYVTETQVVKQSLSSFISVFIPTMIVMIGFPMLMILPSSITMYLIIGLIVFISIIDIIEYLILKNWGVKRFKML